MTVIETMKQELTKTQLKQWDFVDQWGIVKPAYREAYINLVRLAKEIKEGIEYLESISK